MLIHLYYYALPFTEFTLVFCKTFRENIFTRTLIKSSKCWRKCSVRVYVPMKQVL